MPCSLTCVNDVIRFELHHLWICCERERGRAQGRFCGAFENEIFESVLCRRDIHDFSKKLHSRIPEQVLQGEFYS